MHYITGFTDKICAHHEVERADVLHTFERALRDAATSVIGPADLDVQFTEHGAVAVYRVFTVTDSVSDPARQLDLGALRRIESFADAEAGEEILLKLPMRLADLTNMRAVDDLEELHP